MDHKTETLKQSEAVDKKLKKITKKITKSRKNFTKIKSKEAAEFEEIHKLLGGIDDENEITDDTNHEFLDCSILPLKSTESKIFNDERLFFVFNHKTSFLEKFISSEEDYGVFRKEDFTSSEDYIRKLIKCRADENLMQKEGESSSINLYVFYLMSVHPDPYFVSACFDFLKFHPFQLHIKDIFPVFVNFGLKEDLFGWDENDLIEKFGRNNEKCQNDKFPFFNMEMVGKILVHYTITNLIEIGPDISVLVKGLAKITLDPKILSGSLLPIYSTLLTTLCLAANDNFTLKEITNWLYFKEEPLLNRLEICRIVSKSIFSDLHDSLILTNISSILSLNTYISQVPIKIDFLKSVLKELKSKKVQPLEFYCVLQLLNDSLPGVTATKEDSLDINTTLASLGKKVSEIKDSVSAIRLKVEIAKVGNLVTNNKRSYKSYGDETLKMYAKKVKCSK